MAEEIIIVQGNNALSGEVAISGAKNSALKLIAASLLGRGRSIIRNVPLISDIAIMSEVLRRLGATVEREGHALVVDTTSVDRFETPYDLVSKMRASISVLGPLIGRFGCAHVAMPGGCQIGARKIDMHLKRARGARGRVRDRARFPEGDEPEGVARRARGARFPQRRGYGEPAHGSRCRRGCGFIRRYPPTHLVSVAAGSMYKLQISYM